MQKSFVEVECLLDSDGIIDPRRIRWRDGRCWRISKVIHTCSAAHNEFEGIRYTVKIGRAERYIYRDGQQWYVDSSETGGGR